VGGLRSVPPLRQCPRTVRTADGRNVGAERRTKSLGGDSKWLVTALSGFEFSSVRKQSGLFADLTHVPEGELG
jgi:hypothetical protein